MKSWAMSMLVVGLLATVATAREWTDATGKAKIEAEYLGVEGNQAKLKFADGQIKMVPLATLSEADKKFVKEQTARDEAAKEAEAAPADRFTQAINQDPTNAELYVNRGMARTNRGEMDDAIKDFSKAIELDPKNAHAYNGRGLALQKKNELVSAQNDFNESIKLDPELPSAYKNRGENLRKLALDPKQHVPELDESIDKWQRLWNLAHKSNTSNTPWQPLHAIKGDVGRPAAMMQMAKIDFEYADRVEHEHHGDWGHSEGGHGGTGGCAHGPGCGCPACSGTACPNCNGEGCEKCNSGKPAPPLGVYPAKVKQGETITLVANASQLEKGMPADAKPAEKGQKGKSVKTKVPLIAVDFYRDADGNGKFNAEKDQYLGSDTDGKDGYMLKVPTAELPPGTQSFFAVGRGAEGSGKGASAEDMLKGAETLEKAAEKEKQVAQACEAGKEQGLAKEQCESLAKDQGDVGKTADEVASKVGQACPEVGKLLGQAGSPMKAAKTRLATAEKKPGEANKGDAENAAEKAKLASEKLAAAAAKLREAAEAAKAAQTEGRPVAATAACGAPTAGFNEIVAAGGAGPGSGDGPGPGGPGSGGDDTVVTKETVVKEAADCVRDRDYDTAVSHYDDLLVREPENATYLRDRAATHLLRGGYDYAIRDYDRLLKVKEPDAELYYNRGCAFLAGGKLQEAISDFNKSISLNEVYSLAYNNRGAAYARMADYAKATEDFSKAIEIEPSNHLAYRNRALAYKKLGELQKAEADFAVVVRLEKESKTAVVEK